MIQIGHYLALAAILFTLGAVGFLVRRNAIVALMSIELMLNAVNLTLIAFNRFQHAAELPSTSPLSGSVSAAEFADMASRRGVWLFAPPQGSAAYGLDQLGHGRGVWAVLPPCGPNPRPNPDNEDHCPVDRLEVTTVGTGPEVRVGGAQPIAENETQRLQAFVIPDGVQQVHLRVLRHDSTVRFDATVSASLFAQLEMPDGHMTLDDTTHEQGFDFEALARYHGPVLEVSPQGQIFALFVIAVAAAEAAVGLAIVLSLYRVRKVVRTDDANLLKE